MHYIICHMCGKKVRVAYPDAGPDGFVDTHFWDDEINSICYGSNDYIDDKSQIIKEREIE